MEGYSSFASAAGFAMIAARQAWGALLPANRTYSAAKVMGSEWRSSFDRTASIATGIFHPIRPTRGFAVTSARFARIASRANFIMCAPTAVAVSPCGQSGRHRSGGPGCPSRNVRPPISACICRTASTTSPHIRRGSGLSHQRNVDLAAMIIPPARSYPRPRRTRRDNRPPRTSHEMPSNRRLRESSA